MISDKKIRSRLAQQNFQMMSLKKVQSLLKLLKSCIGHVKKISQGETIFEYVLQQMQHLDTYFLN